MPLRHGSAITAAVLIACYVIVTALDARRLFWHDELFTYYIAKAPSMARLWHELQLDLNPPLAYLAARASLRIFGDSQYAARLPSIVMFLVGSLCFYKLVSERLRAIYGAFTLLVVWTSAFFEYATEARPYALVVGFFGLALLAYERAVRPTRSIWSIAGLAAAVVGMMLSHFFSVFYIGPICLAELVRSYRQKRLDVAIWLALLVPCVIPFAYLRLVARFEASYFPPEFKVTPLRGILFYRDLLKIDATPLLLSMVAALAISYRPSAISKVLHRDRDSLSWASVLVGLLAIPVVIELAILRSHGAFFDRYALLAVFGLAAVFAAFLAALTAFNRVPGAAACAVLLAFFAHQNVSRAALRSHWASYWAPSAAEQSKELESKDPNLALVAASGLTFLEMDHYASPATVRRLYYLTDPKLAIEVAHATIFEGFATLKKYFPIRANVEPYRQFVGEHSQFLVLGTVDYPEDWLLRHLLHIHAQVEFLGEVPGPYKDVNLFLITMPAGSGDAQM